MRKPNLLTSLLISALTWPLHLSLGFLLYIVGWALVPLALLFRATEERFTIFGVFRQCFSWPFMLFWQNYEDGIAGPPYYSPPLNINPVLAWTCIRNPVNGLRWVPVLSFKINQSLVQYVGSLGQGGETGLLYEEKRPSIVYVWHGAYACLWLHFSIPFTDRLGRFFIGHKLYANDAYTSKYGYRQHGTGFALQFKVVQKGQNKN